MILIPIVLLIIFFLVKNEAQRSSAFVLFVVSYLFVLDGVSTTWKVVAFIYLVVSFAFSVILKNFNRKKNIPAKKSFEENLVISILIVMILLLVSYSHSQDVFITFDIAKDLDTFHAKKIDLADKGLVTLLLVVIFSMIFINSSDEKELKDE